MHRYRRAFTLVELLVVITIIGILVGMLMPAVQSARETARINSCKNNISQLAKAWQLHEAAHQFFPCGGWGYLWIGDPDRGFDRKQPGGWVYNILPFVEQQALHDFAAGQSATEKFTRLGEMVQTPLAFTVCPSRRRPIPYGNGGFTYRNATSPAMDARSDYAANGGGAVGSCGDAGPGSLAAGDILRGQSGAYNWACSNENDPTNTTKVSAMKGILVQHAELRSAEIRDGLTCTYLVGEKYMNADNYLTGLDPSDDQTMYLGWDQDIIRWTASSATPMKDVPGTVMAYSFGSPHATAFNMSFCDGSVHSVNYAIDPTMHQRFGTRDDGLPTDDTAIIP